MRIAPLSRPALRWHGGKWLLAPWIIEHFPAHRVYVEPFGGGGSVLIRKRRCYAEVYNDLDDSVVALFRVLRNEAQAARLIRELALTPFARAEFAGAYDPPADDYERARFLCIRSFMGFGSDAHNTRVKGGFRSDSNKSGTLPAHDWGNYPEALRSIVERLRGVVIEHRDAAEVMARHDGPDTLFYVDPPYLPGTRSTKSRKSGDRYHAYVHELTIEDHEELLLKLRDLAGMVVLSGYPAPLYDAMLPGWRRVEREALADGARPRIEVLWINPLATERLRGRATMERLI